MIATPHPEDHLPQGVRVHRNAAHSTLYRSRLWRKQWPGVADALVSVAGMILKRGLP